MTRLLLSAIVLLISTEAFAQTTAGDPQLSRTIIHNGVGLGAVIAVVTSWSRSNSVLWAILHGLLSWLYVIYFVVTRQQED